MALPLWQQIGHGDLTGREGKRHDHGRWSQRPDGPISPSVDRPRVGTLVSIDFEDAIDEVYDPVLSNSCPRVEAALVFAVEVEARVRHLDDERGALEVRMAIVGGIPRYDDQIRLELGLVVE